MTWKYEIIIQVLHAMVCSSWCQPCSVRDEGAEKEHPERSMLGGGKPGLAEPFRAINDEINATVGFAKLGNEAHAIE